MITANLQYFKPNGTFYSSASFQVISIDFLPSIGEIHGHVRDLRNRGRLPGLALASNDQAREFIVHVDVPAHPNNFPGLILLP